MELHFWLALVVFFAAYGMIILDKIHRTVVALLGAALVVTMGVLSQEKAIEAIDFNTIGLLVGMMIIVGITKRSGVFEYLAVKAANMVGGKPIAILIALAVVTAITSAFLDNVTTVLLIVPITISLTDRLKVSPIPFLFAQIFASNIGGTATLIGDPPNIMIGSAAHLGFMDFVKNLLLPTSVILLVTVGIMAVIYKKQLQAGPEEIKAVLSLDAREQIKDTELLKKSLLVLGLVIIGFVLHQYLHMESATIALAGAALLMLITAESPDEVLLSVEWPTIFFFVGLFIIVGGLVEVGVIEMVARYSLNLTHGSVLATGMLVLWLSAIASAFVDNIPFVATMIPLLQSLGHITHLPSAEMQSLWWALSLGACLGGNGTVIGASANVIVAGIAERHDHPISFIRYFKTGFPLMLVSIVICTLYLYLFYWR